MTEQGNGHADQKDLIVTSPKTLARLAGVLYIVGALGPVFAMFIRSSVIVSGDAAATADNVRASESLVRAGVALGLVSLAAWPFAVMILYRTLRHGGQLAAGAMALTVGAAVAVECLNLVTLYTALRVATSTAYTGVVGDGGADALVMLAVELQRSGALLVGLFWGLWLLPLGYLVMRSGVFPKVLGALLIVGGMSYLAVHVVPVVAPNLAGAVGILLVGDIGELFFVVWLLIRGVGAPAATTPKPPIAAGDAGL